MRHTVGSLRITRNLLKHDRKRAPQPAHLWAHTLKKNTGLILVLMQTALITNGRLITTRPNVSIHLQSVSLQPKTAYATHHLLSQILRCMARGKG